MDNKLKWKTKYEKMALANKELREINRKVVSREIALAREFQHEFRKQLATLITAAFGFVAALFWNTAIKDAINAFIPPAQTWVGEIFVAVFVTVIAVLAIWLVSRGTGEKKEPAKIEQSKPQTP